MTSRELKRKSFPFHKFWADRKLGEFDIFSKANINSIESFNLKLSLLKLNLKPTLS